MTESLAKPAVVTHAYFSAAAVRDDPAAVDKMWSAATGLGITDPIPGSGWPVDPAMESITATPGGLTMLAGAQQELTDGLNQAIAYQLHDVVGISVLQSTDETATRTWADMTTDWFGDWATPADGMLGIATIHLAVVTGRSRARAWSDTPGDVTVAFPGVALPDWRRTGWRPVPELLIWELPAPAHPLRSRRLLAVTSADEENVMDDWFWGGQSLSLPPFTGYLLHAAKLRYERAVLGRDVEAIGTILTDVGRRCDELAATLGRPTVSVGDVLDAERALDDLRWRQDGLSATLNAVRDMSGTVQVAQANMRSAIDGASAGPPGSPAANDRQLARWTQQQLRVEENYLRAAQARGDDTKRLAAATVDEVLQQRRERLGIVQTAIIGAILMALTGIQAVSYKVTWLPGPLVAPTVFGLAALALLLPFALLRRPLRVGLVDVVCALVFGAAMGWVVASLAAQPWRAHHHGADTWTSLYSAAAGAVIAVAISVVTPLLRRKWSGRGRVV